MEGVVAGLLSDVDIEADAPCWRGRRPFRLFIFVLLLMRIFSAIPLLRPSKQATLFLAPCRRD
ncbi:hypothetical protein CSUI_005632 [Cystoisospora suis]|uniref:Uncharacterized protein n=1 Tax=Cystoisospora suis TaxID=483139 RepID=A0A2C6KWV1_9APIC|nr:hypothetical protein CSUI_005632 [Cystoisospora suis]